LTPAYSISEIGQSPPLPQAWLTCFSGAPTPTEAAYIARLELMAPVGLFFRKAVPFRTMI
jgi:hypothetical protein